MDQDNAKSKRGLFARFAQASELITRTATSASEVLVDKELRKYVTTYSFGCLRTDTARPCRGRDRGHPATLDSDALRLSPEQDTVDLIELHLQECISSFLLSAQESWDKAGQRYTREHTRCGSSYNCANWLSAARQRVELISM
jgi:hypothetical protein